MQTPLDFKKNKELTVGVELELQLVNLKNFNLAMEAEDYLRRLQGALITGEIKPEITKSMIEINSSIHSNFESLLDELCDIRNALVQEAQKTHIGICGGGAHPFQEWSNQRIFPTKRFEGLSEQYGYLAKQFTIFGQHIHIACPSGEDALYLCHALARYLPHFIALSASSPFQQSIDTAFDCSRLTIVSAFPLSGTPPWIFEWHEFENYFQKMVRLGVIKSMKDFYWDIRPKPEFGTVELRICDTPLTVDIAAELAAYAQALVSYLLDQKSELNQDIYLTYLINRFRTARYGMEAIIIDPIKQKEISISEDILETCDHIMPYATKLKSLDAIEKIRQYALSRKNGACWIREAYHRSHCLNDVVRDQTSLWMNKNF
jgi:carboxylate-amine ligase